MKAYVERFHDPAGMRHALTRAYRHAEKAVAAGAHEVVIRKAVKSREQEECYHALIGDIADQYQHAGRKWDAEDMKRILVDAFKHDTKDDADLMPLWRQMGDLRLVPAIGRDGFVPLGEQTRRFPSRLAAAFIDWLHAFGDENDVQWTDPNWQSLVQARTQARAAA